MSDYAARRDAGFDAATSCMTCGDPVPRHSVLHLFCSRTCHTEALAYPASHRDADTTDEVRANTLTLDDVLAYDHPQPGPTVRQVLEYQARFRRLYLNNPTAAEPNSSRLGASTDDLMTATDQLTAPKVRIGYRDHISHDHHTREMRGAIATGLIAIITAVLAVSYLLDASWIAGGVFAAGGIVSGGVSWISWGNARAATAVCRICHPPCDDATG